MSTPPPNLPDPAATGIGSAGSTASVELDDIVRQASELAEKDRLSFLRAKSAGNNLLLAQALERLKISSPRWWDMSIESRVLDRSDGLHERSGEMIGAYRIIRSLGVGGMGEVVLAERDDQQFRQQVAIKLVKRGALSATIQARLKVERQILASLDHPNIARLLDGGADDNGTPYIVMEYIEGEAIDVFCDRNRLGIDERIELFRTVCSAVHYAHQNLIVHRDLKPSNILVTADGTPKLLDFGIAKIIDDRPLMHTMAVTQMDMRVMTPEHASPEQVRGDLITTVSDVYCLGVLLFELLSGSRPYVITSQRLSEIERAICDEEPKPLQTSLQGRDGSAIERLCEQRSTTRPKLRRALSGDLADIVMTALRKEPERRYASVEQFSADLGRYLSGMPVAASKDSWQYRAQKFAQRHRWGVSIGSLAIVGIIAFAVVTVIQARLIAREQARAEYVSSFLIGMFENADPSHSRGKDITVRETLDVGASSIKSQFKEQAEMRAKLQETVGTVYSGLGLYDDAEKLLRESLAERIKLYGRKHVETADAMEKLGDVLLNRSNFAEATPFLQDALVIYRREYGSNGLKVAAALRNLGIAFAQQQKPVLAEQYLRESLSLLERQITINKLPSSNVYVEMSETLNRLGLILDEQGNYSGAIDLYQRSLEIIEKWVGRDHRSFAVNQHNLGLALQQQGRLTEAEPLFRESLDTIRKVFGAEHSYTLSALANYGVFLRRLRDLDGAERVDREVLALDRKIRGETHSLTGFDQVSLGLVLYDKKQYGDAEAEFRQAIAIYNASLPENHVYKGDAHNALALTLIALGRNREAEKESRNALQIYGESLTGNNPRILSARATQGKSLADQKRFAEAEPLLLDNYRLLLATLNAEHPAVVRTHEWITDFYAARGHPEQAGAFFASIKTPVSDKEKY